MGRMRGQNIGLGVILPDQHRELVKNLPRIEVQAVLFSPFADGGEDHFQLFVVISNARHQKDFEGLFPTARWPLCHSDVSCRKGVYSRYPDAGTGRWFLKCCYQAISQLCAFLSPFWGILSV